MKKTEFLMASTRKSRSGPSGRSPTHAERIAAGRTRVVVWLDAADTAALERLTARPEAEGERSQAVRLAIRDAARRSSDERI